MEQIEKLWDSILLDYPIATFLFWHVDDDNVTWDTYFCNFLSEVTFDSRKQADSVNYELSNIDVKITDTAVLSPTQFEIKSILDKKFQDETIREQSIEEAIEIEDILNSKKGSRVAGEALYYLSLDWINKNYKYEQDHLHPFDRFDGSKPISISMEDWRKWRGNRNRLPNLQLLEGRSNGSKNNMRLVDYYNDMNDDQKAEFCKEAIIPDGVSLELEHFDEFYEKRKAILTEKIRALLG